MKVTFLFFLSLASVASFAQSLPDGLNAKYLEHQEFVPTGDPIEISTSTPAPTPASTTTTVKQDSTQKKQLGEKVSYNSGIVDSDYHGQLESGALNIHSTKSKQYNRRVEEKANNSNQGAGVNNN